MRGATQNAAIHGPAQLWLRRKMRRMRLRRLFPTTFGGRRVTHLLRFRPLISLTYAPGISRATQKATHTFRRGRRAQGCDRSWRGAVERRQSQPFQRLAACCVGCGVKRLPCRESTTGCGERGLGPRDRRGERAGGGATVVRAGGEADGRGRCRRSAWSVVGERADPVFGDRLFRGGPVAGATVRSAVRAPTWRRVRGLGRGGAWGRSGRRGPCRRGRRGGRGRCAHPASASRAIGGTWR